MCWSLEDTKDLIKSIIILAIITIIISYLSVENDNNKEDGTMSGFQCVGDMSQIVLPGNGDNPPTQEEEAKLQQIVPVYNLTKTERDLIERVVMGMAGDEDTTTQKAIAQCILNACYLLDKRPDNIIKNLRYPLYRPTPSEEVKQSVTAIFDYGEYVLDKDVMYLYNYIGETSQWHETQEYVCTIGSYKFFKAQIK